MLATWSDNPQASLSFDPSSARENGELFGEALDSPIAGRWDPRSDFEHEEDLGWIGEDIGGVWISVHPHVALHEHPRIWDGVARFTCGLQEMTPHDWDTLSAFEFDVKLTMVSAANRKLARDNQPKEGGGDDD